MIALLALFVSPFKSKGRLEAENAALRHQLIKLRRKVHGRVRLTDGDVGCGSSIASLRRAARLRRMSAMPSLLPVVVVLELDLLLLLEYGPACSAAAGGIVPALRHPQPVL